MPEFNSNLWAPWRMEYIRSMEEEEREDGCFICRYVRTPEQDAEHHVVMRGAHCLVLLNRFPYTNGHLLIAVNRHVGDPEQFSEPEMHEMSALTFRFAGILRRAVNAHGFNIGVNLGRCAGAGLPDHMHTHIVPRWNGDTNYMAVTGGVRVIPDALDAVYDQLVKLAVELGLRAP